MAKISLKGLTLLILIIISGILGLQRNRVWKDEFTLWSDVVKKAPENWRALYNLALEFHKRGEYDNALAHLKRIVDTGGYRWNVLSKIGSVLADKGLYEEALIWHKRALSVAGDRERAGAYNYMGVTYFKKKDYESAEKALKEALNIDPEHYESYYNLGVVYWYKNETEKAIECFKNVIKRQPYYYDAYFNLGVIYGNRDDLDRAIYYFSGALSVKETPEAYMKRSLAYRLKGDLKGAEKDMLRARSLGYISHEE